VAQLDVSLDADHPGSRRVDGYLARTREQQHRRNIAQRTAFIHRITTQDHSQVAFLFVTQHHFHQQSLFNLCNSANSSVRTHTQIIGLRYQFPFVVFPVAVLIVFVRALGIVGLDWWRGLFLWP
jgi:hypothetical protein